MNKSNSFSLSLYFLWLLITDWIVCKQLTRILIILFGDTLQQCVQGSCVILHDPVGYAAEERVRVQPGAVVTTSISVTAQDFLIKKALASGWILKVSLVQSCYYHG